MGTLVFWSRFCWVLMALAVHFGISPIQNMVDVVLFFNV